MTNLTVGTLRKMLESLPDEMEVIGWSDYYPGIAEAESSGVQKHAMDFLGEDEKLYFVVDGN